MLFTNKITKYFLSQNICLHFNSLFISLEYFKIKFYFISVLDCSISVCRFFPYFLLLIFFILIFFFDLMFLNRFFLFIQTTEKLLKSSGRELRRALFSLKQIFQVGYFFVFNVENFFNYTFSILIF